MRLLPWSLLLAVLVFATGWTSRLWVDRIAPREAPSSSFEKKRNCQECGSHYRSGPVLSSVERFAEELNLSAEQRVELDVLIARTQEGVRQCDERKRYLFQENVAQVRDLLTADQHEMLGELSRRKWDSYADESMKRLRAWLEVETELVPEDLERVEAILREYETFKADYLATAFLEGAGLGWHEIEAKMDAARKDRDHRLGQYLDPETLERLERASRRGRRRSRCP